jgi:hypothetical protein|tara:strand:- start:380 stop:508 length:129 start_codon:yes stop_codon:yes gene_type:complete
MSILRKPLLGEFVCCAELVVTIPDVFNGSKPQQNKTVYLIKW